MPTSGLTGLKPTMVLQGHAHKGSYSIKPSSGLTVSRHRVVLQDHARKGSYSVTPSSGLTENRHRWWLNGHTAPSRQLGHKAIPCQNTHTHTDKPTPHTLLTTIHGDKHKSFTVFRDGIMPWPNGSNYQLLFLIRLTISIRISNECRWSESYDNLCQALS